MPLNKSNNINHPRNSDRQTNCESQPLIKDNDSVNHQESGTGVNLQGLPTSESRRDIESKTPELKGKGNELITCENKIKLCVMCNILIFIGILVGLIIAVANMTSRKTDSQIDNEPQNILKEPLYIIRDATNWINQSLTTTFTNFLSSQNLDTKMQTKISDPVSCIRLKIGGTQYEAALKQVVVTEVLEPGFELPHIIPNLPKALQGHSSLYTKDLGLLVCGGKD